MAICAIVEADGSVRNTILADPQRDKPPAGCTLVLIESDEAKGSSIDTKFVQDTRTGTFKPTLEYQAKLDAEAATKAALDANPTPEMQKKQADADAAAAVKAKK